MTPGTWFGATPHQPTTPILQLVWVVVWGGLPLPQVQRLAGMWRFPTCLLRRLSRPTAAAYVVAASCRAVPLSHARGAVVNGACVWRVAGV